MSSLPVRAAVTRLHCCGRRADSIRNGSARPAEPAEPFASPDPLLADPTSTRSPTAEPTPTTTPLDADRCWRARAVSYTSVYETGGSGFQWGTALASWRPP